MLRIQLDDRDDDTEADYDPQNPRDNTELVRSMMDYSRTGAMAQMFIIDAIGKQADLIAAMSPETIEAAMAGSFVNGRAWHAAAVEIQTRLSQFYNRHAH